MVQKKSRNLCSLTIVETEHAAEAFPLFDGTGVQVDYRRRFKQSVAASLVISLPQIMGFIFRERPAKPSFTEKDHTRKTFFLIVARHPIQVVASRTGLSLHVLRAWERRCGAINPRRAAGNRRLYSEEDIERLRLLRQLEEIDLPELRRIGLRLQGVPRGAYLPYVTLGTTQKTES